MTVSPCFDIIHFDDFYIIRQVRKDMLLDILDLLFHADDAIVFFLVLMG
jgi:hypothetical protein